MQLELAFLEQPVVPDEESKGPWDQIDPQAQIAALVGVPADVAVVREESPDKREIPVGETVRIKDGEHFLVTRKIVEGGHVLGAN